MSDKCKHCGWERPGGNYVHTRDACDDMREKALQKVVGAAKEWAEYAPPKKWSERGQAIVDALAELPEYWRGEG